MHVHTETYAHLFLYKKKKNITAHIIIVTFLVDIITGIKAF